MIAFFLLAPTAMLTCEATKWVVWVVVIGSFIVRGALRLAERAVTEALSERLVDKVASIGPTIAFPHALIREALNAGSDETSDAELHLRIAEALDEDLEAEPSELARHYGLAVAVAGPERVIAAYEAAAQAAAEAHDHEQAAAQLRRALSLIPESEGAARAPLSWPDVRARIRELPPRRRRPRIRQSLLPLVGRRMRRRREKRFWRPTPRRTE